MRSFKKLSRSIIDAITYNKKGQTDAQKRYLRDLIIKLLSKGINFFTEEEIILNENQIDDLFNFSLILFLYFFDKNLILMEESKICELFPEHETRHIFDLIMDCKLHGYELNGFVAGKDSCGWLKIILFYKFIFVNFEESIRQKTSTVQCILDETLINGISNPYKFSIYVREDTYNRETFIKYKERFSQNLLAEINRSNFIISYEPRIDVVSNITTTKIKFS